MSYNSKVQFIGISSPEVKDAHDLLAGRKVTDPTLFICEGLWAADKLIEKQIEVLSVFFDGEFYENSASSDEKKTLSAIIAYAQNAYSVSAKVCARISDRDGADNCFIIARMPSYSLDDLDLPENLVTIIMDGQEQPGNVGAILRSLDAAGGKFAFLTNRRVKLTHSRLIRSSLGAAFMMPVLDVPMNELIPWLQKNRFRVVLTDLTATKAFNELETSGRVAIVAGNEHTGISPEWRDLPEAEPIIIPMLGTVESLNVGFASTMVAYYFGLGQA